MTNSSVLPSEPDGEDLCLFFKEFFLPLPESSLAEQALEAAGEAIIVFDRDRQVVLVNQSAAGLYGRENAEAGAHCWRVFHHQRQSCQKPPSHCWLRRVFASGKPFRTVIDQETADNEPMLVAVSAAPVFDRRHQVQNVVVILRNVTEELECLKSGSWWRAAESNRAILDSLGEGVLLLDRHYRVLASNKKIEEFSGIQHEQARGRYCYQVSHGRSSPCWQDNEPEHPCPVRETLETGRASAAVHLHHSPGHGKKYIEVRAFPLKDETGQVFQVVETHTDITAQKLLEKRLEQAQKLEAIGTLAGGIAHDFNNILTPILGNTELLLAGMDQEAPHYAELQEIRTAARRASEMVRHILAFSRQQILRKQSLRLGDLVVELHKILLRLIPENIELLTVPEDDSWRILADPTQIQQIIINLAVNARDAMVTGGTLVIETREVARVDTVCHTCGEPITGDHLLLMVSDNGIGMDDALLSHVFEPFFTTKEPGKGTGMGLSTVLGIMHQHHGHINVYSEPGVGTTFKVYFPRAREDGPQARLAVSPAGAGLLPRGEETILVVDDDPMVRTLLRKILTTFGYQVLEAASGAEALEVFDRHRRQVALVITDIVMPRMNGKELVERIQASRPGVAALYMSGYSDNAIHSQGILAPGVEYLQKPPLLHELLNRVRTILDQS